MQAVFRGQNRSQFIIISDSCTVSNIMIMRYNDGILLISESNTVSMEIIENLKNTFREYDQDLTIDNIVGRE